VSGQWPNKGVTQKREIITIEQITTPILRRMISQKNNICKRILNNENTLKRRREKAKMEGI